MIPKKTLLLRIKVSSWNQSFGHFLNHFYLLKFCTVLILSSTKYTTFIPSFWRAEDEHSLTSLLEEREKHLKMSKKEKGEKKKKGRHAATFIRQKNQMRILFLCYKTFIIKMVFSNVLFLKKYNFLTDIT